MGPKVHIVATWGTIKKLNISTLFDGPVVLRLCEELLSLLKIYSTISGSDLVGRNIAGLG